MIEKWNKVPFPFHKLDHKDHNQTHLFWMQYPKLFFLTKTLSFTFILQPLLPMAPVCNWAELDYELLYIIAKMLFLNEDFMALVAFGCVCTSWRSIWACMKEDSQRFLPHYVWLMLAEEEDDNDDGGEKKRGFFSLNQGNVRYLNFPQVTRKQCFSLIDGWLITIGEDHEVKLVHFLSHVTITLPSWSTLDGGFDLDVEFPFYILRAGLSANPSHVSDFVVFIICGTGLLAFARPGDHAWSIQWNAPVTFSDAIFYNDMVYAMDWCGNLWVCNIKNPEHTPYAVFLFPKDPSCSVTIIERVYLVGSSGKLLAVFRIGVEDHKTFDFMLYELNLSSKSWIAVRGLENKVLFVGNNSTLCVPTSEVPGCKVNSIYFTDDCVESYLDLDFLDDPKGGEDMGVYNLENKSIVPHFSGISFSCITAPLWVFPGVFP